MSWRAGRPPSPGQGVKFRDSYRANPLSLDARNAGLTCRAPVIPPG